jgi:ABC-type microcin C transport system permease subunit YejB
MQLIKWTGTILCLIGIALTSFNVYPLNILFGLVGSGLWAYAGVLQRDIPLILVEAVAVALYFAGLAAYVS